MSISNLASRENLRIIAINSLQVLGCKAAISVLSTTINEIVHNYTPQNFLSTKINEIAHKYIIPLKDEHGTPIEESINKLENVKRFLVSGLTYIVVSAVVLAIFRRQTYSVPQNLDRFTFTWGVGVGLLAASSLINYLYQNLIHSNLPERPNEEVRENLYVKHLRATIIGGAVEIVFQGVFNGISRQPLLFNFFTGTSGYRTA